MKPYKSIFENVEVDSKKLLNMKPRELVKFYDEYKDDLSEEELDSFEFIDDFYDKYNLSFSFSVIYQDELDDYGKEISADYDYLDRDIISEILRKISYNIEDNFYIYSTKEFYKELEEANDYHKKNYESLMKQIEDTKNQLLKILDKNKIEYRADEAKSTNSWYIKIEKDDGDEITVRISDHQEKQRKSSDYSIEFGYVKNAGKLKLWKSEDTLEDVLDDLEIEN